MQAVGYAFRGTASGVRCNVADGEFMVTAHVARRTRSARPWWRPLVYSAVAAAIGALLAPVPAFADPPSAPQAPYAPAVPDVGSRPMALGTLAMPGQPAATP